MSKDFPEEIDIRGEVFIQNSKFEEIKDQFANPRNAASGSLRQKNPEETSKIPLRFIAYTFGYEKGLRIKNCLFSTIIFELIKFLIFKLFLSILVF